MSLKDRGESSGPEPPPGPKSMVRDWAAWVRSHVTVMKSCFWDERTVLYREVTAFLTDGVRAGEMQALLE